MVIHQPRPEIFALIDNVIVMAAGSVVFTGHPKAALKALEPTGLQEGRSRLSSKTRTRANTGDAIMDAVAGLENSDITRLRKHNSLIRRQGGEGQAAFDARGLLDRNAADRAVPLKHRLAALMLRRRWGAVNYDLWFTFLLCPISIYFAGGLPNAVSGGAPELQEILAQVLLSCLQPVVILLGITLYDMVTFTRSFRWMYRSRVVLGTEATLDVVFYLVSLVALYLVPVTTACVVTGWAQYWTWTMLLRVWALALTGTLFIILVLFAVVVRSVSELDTLDKSCRDAAAVQFLVIVYTGVGVAFGGLMYRPEQIHAFFKALSYTSACFYTQSSIMVVILHELRKYECPSDLDAVAAAACRSKTGLFAAALSTASDTDVVVPTYALLILVVGCCLLCLWLAAIFIRPCRRRSAWMIGT